MLRRCRHLKAFDITIEVRDRSNAGVPPWGIVCEDCAATIYETLRERQAQISTKHVSGKSGLAVTWARIHRLLNDWTLLPGDNAINTPNSRREG